MSPTRLIRCPWCPRHFVARHVAAAAPASETFAATREAFELLVDHARSRHQRDRHEVTQELVERLADG